MTTFNIDTTKGMEFGLYSLGDHVMNPVDGKRISAKQRIDEIIEAAKLAEQAGIDVFGVGESHQTHFTTQAHTVVLGAIAQATEKIKVTSSATVLSVSDPVRVYEDFATIDLISGGRAEIVAGRGSRIGAYHLLGVDVQDYEEIFEEKLELLTILNKEDILSWKGDFRPELKGAAIYPQPIDGKLPIWRAVGGPPASAIKAGRMGIPMMLTTLGGPATNFKFSVDAYRGTLEDSGFNPSDFPLATTSLFYVGETTQDALRGMYPHIDTGFKLIRGAGYPKQQFAEAVDPQDALMVGDKHQIIEKLLYQHELFGMDRFMAQIDFGGVPFDKIMKNIEIIGNDILPVIKKYTAKG